MKKSFVVRWFELLIVLVLLLGLSGCPSGPDMEFVSAGVDENLEEVPVPPTMKELLSNQSNIAFLPIQYSEGLTRYHRVLSNAFVMSVLEEYGDLEVIDEVYVQNHLERTEFRELKRMVEEEKFRRYEQPLVERVIRFGKSLGVSYIGLMSVHTSPVRVSANDWSTYVTFRIMRVEDPPDSSYMNNEFTFIFSESNSLWEELGAQIRGKFPLGGFILESRGGRSYARISIGRRNRVEMDQHCKIFRRIRKESQDSENNLIQVTDFDLLGKMQIFNIQEDFSWGRVEPEARKKILKGDAVRCY
ncbi:MAG: hypothetical protein ACJ0DI_10845 [bacterium]